MKKFLLLGVVAAGFGLFGCTKNPPALDPLDASAARATATDSTGFGRRKITEVAVSALPASVTAYVTTNYAGATIEKAGKDELGNVLVFLKTSAGPKALLFDASGVFKQEVATKGPHGGGPGGPGGPHGPDHGTQIAPKDLPSAIGSYVSANYAGATVDFAVLDSTKGYVVMLTLNTQPAQRKTLLFNLDGTFNKELQRDGHKKDGNVTPVAADLPKAITDYVTANYAGATIARAGKDPTTGEYLVHLHTADKKEVTLLFAADGTFKQAMTHK